MRELIAILRGITPKEACQVVEILINSGINTIEVPLNSPSALKSIELLVKTFNSEIVFGAGTVLNVEQVQNVYDCGGQIIVSPNCNVQVIKKTKLKNLKSIPGVFTASECFAALDNGADALKLFPASLIQPKGFNAIKAVLPKEICCYAVGDINENNLLDWLKVGITGFGIGSAIYKTGDTPDEIRRKSEKFVGSFDQAHLNILNKVTK